MTDIPPTDERIFHDACWDIYEHLRAELDAQMAQWDHNRNSAFTEKDQQFAAINAVAMLCRAVLVDFANDRMAKLVCSYMFHLESDQGYGNMLFPDNH